MFFSNTFHYEQRLWSASSSSQFSSTQTSAAAWSSSLLSIWSECTISPSWKFTVSCVTIGKSIITIINQTVAVLHLHSSPIKRKYLIKKTVRTALSVTSLLVLQKHVTNVTNAAIYVYISILIYISNKHSCVLCSRFSDCSFGSCGWASQRPLRNLNGS